MWITIKMAASKYACSYYTISRRVKEMEQSGKYPGAIRRIKGMEIDTDQFEHFCIYGKGKRNGEEKTLSYRCIT